MSRCMTLWHRLFGILLLALALGIQASPARASGAEVRLPSLVQTEEGIALTGNFALSLSPALKDAVSHGIPLVFQMEVELKRPRWYWVDETVDRMRVDRRLTYNALVRNYRVSEGQEGRNFMNLVDAVAYIARPVEWRFPSGQVKTGEALDVAMRFRLDPAFLPKPFQVISFGDRDWRLDSDWYTFRLTVPPVSGAK